MYHVMFFHILLFQPLAPKSLEHNSRGSKASTHNGQRDTGSHTERFPIILLFVLPLASLQFLTFEACLVCHL